MNVHPRIVFLVIMLVAAFLRLWMLDLRPPHFDEGVNGMFVDQMTEEGFYRYDPENYHGPLHMYATFISQTLGGRNLWALRLPAVLASLLTVWAVWRFWEFFGVRAAGLAAAFAAVSPGFVFFGRYAIHESWMTFFLALTLHGILGVWQRGAKRDLYWLCAGVAGMVLTKETYVIHLVAFGAAFGVLALWQRVIDSEPPCPVAPWHFWTGDIVRGVGVAAVAVLLFYSGFLMVPEAVSGLWKTFGYWFATGMESAGHDKPEYTIGAFLGQFHWLCWLGWFKWPNFYWLAMMAVWELGALVGFLACFYYVGRSDARVRWLAIVASGTLLAFSIIPYKTPWCMVSIIVPFLLVAGAFLASRPIFIWLPVGAFVCAVGLLQSCLLNFRWYDSDSKMPSYVYVQTYREFDTAVAPLLDKARSDASFYHAPGHVMLESYHPLPWVLGDFTNVLYSEDEGKLDAPAFVICSKGEAESVLAALRGEYYRKDFKLRSGLGLCTVFFNAEWFGDVFGDETLERGGKQ